jgi:hypothetical protein
VAWFNAAMKIKFDVARPEFVFAPDRVAHAKARHAGHLLRRHTKPAATRKTCQRARLRATPGAIYATPGAPPRDHGRFDPA